MTGMTRAETAAEAFARGNTLLRQGEVQQALGVFAEAARAERENREYVARYMMVRRIAQLQEGLEHRRNAGVEPELPRAGKPLVLVPRAG
jgi:hypothetical protein